MDTFKSFESKLYTVNESSFTDIALEVFRYQAHSNQVYKAYIQALRVNVSQVRHLEQIPYLPISFFKTHVLQSGQWQPATFFTSSGTTGTTTSKHAVADVDFYRTNAKVNFEYFFGPLNQFHILALLPSYMERTGSSLITMIDYFMAMGDPPYKAYYLNDYKQLITDIEKLRKGNKKLIIWGVSFALLDFAEQFELDLSDCMVFETGGMKGRKKEITRQELHNFLTTRFHLSQVYSEYGMTELFSQAYTKGGIQFFLPPWMKIVGRELSDPFNKGLLDEHCGINIVDLANWRTISFIETEDMGRVFSDGSFEVHGRIDNSDIRGCNLMVQ